MTGCKVNTGVLLQDRHMEYMLDYLLTNLALHVASRLRVNLNLTALGDLSSSQEWRSKRDGRWDTYHLSRIL
jgi:hypothetical protein